MKHNWQYKKLGEICEILDSQRRPVTKSDRQPGPFPYYGATGIQDYVADYIFDGDFLLVGEDGAKWGHNEKSAFSISGKSWVNNHAHILDFRNSPALQRLVEYYLCGLDLSKIIKGAIIPKLTQKNLVSIPIPLPPLEEQQRIVAELDRINAVMEDCRQLLRTFDALAQSLFYDSFGDPISNPKAWPTHTLSSVSKLINGRAYRQDELLSQGKYRVIRVGNFFTNSDYYYSDLELEPDKYIDNGDLIFAWSASFGAFIWEGEKSIYHYHIWKIVYDETIINKIFYKFLLNSMTSSFMKDLHGIGMMHLTKSGMEQYIVPLPPLELQQQFARRIEAIEAQKKAVEKTIATLQTLLDSRMDYWFN